MLQHRNLGLQNSATLKSENAKYWVLMQKYCRYKIEQQKLSPKYKDIKSSK